MPRPSPARVTFAAALALLIYAGCAVSEPIDAEEVAKHRAAGSAGTNRGGSAAAGTAGVDVSGASGSAGSIGSAGTAGSEGSPKTNVTSGQAGDNGATGTGGGVSGQAGMGAGGNGGAGTGGSISGAGGNGGGTSGSAGRGGTTGSGRGGTTGSGGRAGSGVDAGSSPDGAVAATFTDVYTTILVTSCSGSNCHKPGAGGGIDFSSQAAAYDSILPRVVPGNGASSSFYQTVNSGSMPKGAAKLSAANLAKIKSWIDAGALDN